MHGIQKYFPGVHALDDAQLEVRAGEVMALIGENGAGKSTLMKILTGVYTKDAGEIELFGKPVEIHSPRDAQAKGVSIVHQELNLMQDLTVAENIFIGREPSKGVFLDQAKQNRMADELLRSLHLNIDAKTQVKRLTVGKRFTFGGEAPKDQRIYYLNTKELIGNKYGTPSPVPFRVVDQRAGIDIDINIRCFGEYSYRICDPILFYTNVCGNVTDEFARERLDGQLKTELLTALQPAFARISDMGIRYSALPGHTMEMADALNEVLSAKWRKLRGLEIVSFGVSSVKANEEDGKDAQGDAAQRGVYGSHARGGAYGRRAGGGDAGGGEQPERRTCDGVHGHEHGGADGRHERAGALSDGRAAAGGAARACSRACGSARGRLDVRVWQGGQHRQILCRVRQAEARSRRLDVRLRRGEQGQVLCRVRQAEARGRAAVPLRQVRLGAQRPGASAQVLPRVRRPV